MGARPREPALTRLLAFDRETALALRTWGAPASVAAARNGLSVVLGGTAEGRLRQSVAVLAALVAAWLVAWHQNPAQGIRPIGPIAAVVPLLPFLAAAIAWLAVASPWRGLAAYLAAGPLIQVAQPGIFVGQFQIITPTVMVAAVAAGTAFTLWERQRGEGPPALDDIRRRIWLLPAALIGITLVSTAGSPSHADAIPVALNGILIPIVAGCLLVALRPRVRDLWLLAAAIAASAAVGAAINLFEILRLGGSLQAFQTDRALFARLTYYNVGIFGHVLASTVPLTAALAFAPWSRRSRRFRLAIGLLFVLQIVALVATLTKSSWLGAGIGVTVVMLMLAPSRLKRVGVVVGLVAFGVLVVPYPAQFLSRLDVPGAPAVSHLIQTIQGAERYDSWDPGTPAGEISIMERLYATQAAVQMAAENPVFGVGPNQFGRAYARGYRPPAATKALGSAHDFLAEVAAELGLVALLAIVLLLAAAFRATWRVWKTAAGPTRALAAGLLASLVGWMVAAETFDVDIYRTWHLMNFDVLMAALLVAAALALPRAAGAADGDGAGPLKVERDPSTE